VCVYVYMLSGAGKLYRKYNWPAKADIVKALQEMPLDN
jgi:hypothetical protein